jgi:cell division protein FtsB
MDIMKKRKFKFRYILFVLVICYLGYTYTQQQAIIDHNNKDLQGLTQQLNKLQDTQSSLKDQIEFAKSNDYKEKMARERMGLIKPGETVYIFDNKN